MAKVGYSCPVKVPWWVPVTGFQIRTVRSLLAVASSVVPFMMNAQTDLTPSSCP